MNRIRLTIITACVAALAMLAGIGWYRSLHHPANAVVSQVDPNVTIGGAFTLTDTDGHVVTQAALQGKWSAVFFGYTYCPDICPTTLQMLGRAEGLLGPADRLQFLFVTVDPQRDTPAVLKAYLQSGGFPSHVIGLTGSDAQIAQVAKAYHAAYQKVEQKGGYIMAHTGVVYLMNPKGEFVSPLTGDLSPQQAADQIRQAQKDYAAHAH